MSIHKVYEINKYYIVKSSQYCYYQAILPQHFYTGAWKAHIAQKIITPEMLVRSFARFLRAIAPR